MTLDQFNRTILEKTIILTYFSTLECNVCKVLRPKVKELIKDYRNVGFLYVNTQESREIAGQYSVFTVPTIIVFVEGKESKRFSRMISIAELTEYLNRLSDIIN